ncbi:MAG: atoS 3 [Firmicutes bacterium]|nr:atoS 3 [Bacillota bacterium]
MKRFWPQTMQNKMILFTLIIVSVPILLAGYIIKLKTEEALLVEKKTKLFGVVQLLDSYLGEGYNKILIDKNVLNQDRATKIRVLNEALKNYTDVVARAYPGVGTGYYSKELDAIITYGPSADYADKVGLSIEQNHPGRKAMNTSTSLVEFAPMVRGNIMNAMMPIVRNGEVIGYIWANELTNTINNQLAVIDYNIYLSVGVGIIVSVLMILWMTSGFIQDVETIKNGLDNLRFDLRKKLIPMQGEMGQIGEAINHMAQSLINAWTLNENIMHSIADGVITVDTDGIITSINESAEKLTGFTCEEIIDRPYKEIFCEGKEFNSLLLDTLLTGTNYIGIETDYPVKHSHIYCSISTSQLKDSSDNIIGAVVVFRDLSEKHQLQARMIRAERLAALGELMAGVAHEIRNPLTAIKGFVQYLDAADNEEERQEYMPIIIKEVDRVNRVIDTLLYFARPCKTNYTFVNINSLIKETMVLVKNINTRDKVQFELQLDDDGTVIEGDAEQLKQVLLNLLINAVQAIPEQGVICISTGRQDDSFVFVRITDTGSGIKQEDLVKVFDPFFTTKAAGTGLGLAVVQRIINAHYGRIDIISNVGSGTAVILQIPILHCEGEANEQ